MHQPGKYPNSIQDDDRLADFTDQVLDGKLKQAESNVDEELLGLEETILSLKRSLPSTPLDQAAIKQMQVRLNARIRREAQETKRPFWKKWFEPQSRPKFGMAVVAVALLIALVIFLPSVTTSGSPSITATALTPAKNILFIVSILAGIILIFLWTKRPK